MTNEMQLAHAAGLAGVGADFGNGISGNQRSKPIGLKKIHRLLRGRYPLVITMGLLFGVAGGLTGYLSEQPMFTSSFQVDISPTIYSVNSPVGEEIAGYDRLLQTQVAMIKGPELIQRAMDEDEWKAAGGPPQNDSTMRRFATSLGAENYPVDTSMMRVTFSDPDRNIALAGAQSTLKAYKEFFDQTDPMMYSQMLQELDKDKTKYQNDYNTYQQQLRDIENLFNTDDLSSYQSTNMERLGKLSNDLADAKMQLDVDQRSLGKIQQGPLDASGNPTSRTSPLTEDQIEAFDNGVLRGLKAQRDELVTQIQRMNEHGYGDEAPQVQYLRGDLTVLDKKIQDYIGTYNQGYRINPENGGSGLTSISGEIVTLKVKIDYLQAQFDQQQAKCAFVGKYKETISDLKNEMDVAKTNLARTSSDYDRMVSVQDVNGRHRMTVISTPIAPTDPSTDKRQAMATFGFVGGALLPTLVVLLLSLLDGRFRYSDEANSDLAGIPLLGILPNLPDLLTDPAQAATAAHCVHQIRTILQITGHSTERRVFAITSASPGDGKTSLTLALGLSFAASGSRTLLVDGDLIGGGLTACLNVNAEHGILEAMASRDITPFIRTTDVADLSFLPVGRAMGGYTGTISPAAVRRLVDEARKQFDVILIDTGPILGSIEASPVAVASDGVVLCVSRGQQRQLVDRALAHLHAIGGKLAGVVFNRAQAHDFERSTNRLGLSSVPAGTDGRRSEAIGPVARAVASSVRSSSGNDH
jgi:capsular exopolysaccharide synthesis family protein